MYRVITTYRDASATRPIIERGPWHATQELAHYWADVLRGSGYATRIESQRSGVDHGADAGGNDNAALAEALASMA